jgi:hypothetical protein
VDNGTDHELWWHDHRQHAGLPYKVTSPLFYPQKKVLCEI